MPCQFSSDSIQLNIQRRLSPYFEDNLNLEHLIFDFQLQNKVDYVSKCLNSDK